MKLIEFPGRTIGDVPVENVLDAAKELKKVFVAGEDENGKFVFSMSTGDMTWAVYILQDFMHTLFRGILTMTSWISVEERLPEDGRLVSVTISGEQIGTVTDWSELGQCLFDPMSGHRVWKVYDTDGFGTVPYCYEVIAWMPLPEVM